MNRRRGLWQKLSSMCTHLSELKVTNTQHIDQYSFESPKMNCDQNLSTGKQAEQTIVSCEIP